MIDLAADLESRGGSVDELGEACAIAALVAEAYLPKRWELDDEVGPFFETSGVCERLGVTRQRVHALANQGRLLKVMTTDHVAFYPAFQFDGREPVHGLREVLAEFAEAEDPWMVATWFISPDPGLDGRSPIQALRDGATDEAAGVARDMAVAWRS